MNTSTLKVLRKLRVANALNLCGSRLVLDMPLRFPIRGKLGWDFVDDAEVWMTQLLVALRGYFTQRSNQAFLDVGVNIGQTLVKYRAVMPEALYVGFEPNPACVAYVNELVQWNRIQNIDLYPVGVAQSAGLCALNFFHDSAIDSSASIIAEFRPEEPIKKKVHVALFPLDQVGLKCTVSFLKIDVEGAELEVLRGSETMLRRDRPLVCCEILPCYNASNVFRMERQEAVESLMNDLEYHCYRIQKSGSRHEELAGLERLETIDVHDQMHLSDYLWIPREQATAVVAMVSQQAEQ